ncbi:MAG: HipA domain-containing protein [Verrucomicrobiales bacterium]|nr:HipA domain-containing protein [Verrucomicrobiales bacterium]
MLASNHDDHLRNHGFLTREAGKWSLSHAYDPNPVPEIDRAQTPKTAISEEQEAPSIAAALEVAPRFGLRGPEARTVLREVLKAVLGWRKTARQLRMSAGSMAAYSSAFEHDLVHEAAQRML